MDKKLPKEPNKTEARLMSLDALRGFDMLWIIGGGQLIQTLAGLSSWSWINALGKQMHHVNWEGFRFYDLIFPLFMFIAGVSTTYAILGKREKGVSKKRLAWGILRRVATLVVLGMVYNGLLNFDFANLRVASVLGQIGIAYGIAATVVLFSRTPRTPLLWCIGIMIIYAVIQLWVPVPEHGAGVLTAEGSINGYIDRLLLPGRMHQRTFDPEGLLCIVSASAIVLLGTLSGFLLRSKRYGGYRKVAVLAGTGVCLILLGLVISPFYPPIKKVWTTTFNLLAGGTSMLLLSAFYLVIDLWKLRRWSFFFRVIGLNSITIYLAVKMIHFNYTSRFLFSGISGWCGSCGPAVLIAGTLALEWVFLWALYKKKIFLKV
ncbi:MAG: DUF5009 domain-containing protein [Verrucomicrobia bacterium]|nr:DUF5009 domain-containing protein [Verrucomicrobiota bacterium]